MLPMPCKEGLAMTDVIVLAGGLGTRLRQVVPDLPKPLAPVGGRPFLELLLCSLADKGFRRAILSLGYMAEKVIAHFENCSIGIDLVYEIETQPLGTGGAVRQAMQYCSSDHVFVVNGDTYLDFEANDLEGRWQKNRVPIIVGLAVPDAARYGRLETVGGRITGFSEKGVAGPGLINAGCYVLPTNILNEFPLGQAFSLETDFLVRAVSIRRFDLFESKGYFIDIGVPEDYARAQARFGGGRLGRQSG
jgi:D-glycero-alpha-D-manno-heptose 1-phosphate guanylyltransferase